MPYVFIGHGNSNCRSRASPLLPSCLPWLGLRYSETLAYGPGGYKLEHIIRNEENPATSPYNVENSELTNGDPELTYDGVAVVGDCKAAMDYSTKYG